jgi:hypothetical protein
MDPSLAAGAIANPDVDGTDPIVVGLTWLTTWMMMRYLPDGERSDTIRRAIPVLCVLFAVGWRAALDTFIVGADVDLATVLRGVAAGAAAVAGHSQIRELQKVVEARREAVDDG